MNHIPDATAAGDGSAFDPQHAAALLDPPLTVAQVRALITLAGLRPIGNRRSGPRGGRPPFVYSQPALVRAHAVVVPLLALPAGS